jgi:hypothetical protein
MPAFSRADGLLAAVALSVAAIVPAQAQDATALAKDLSNPIASLTSVPVQLNFDENFGVDEQGDRYLLNVQPVIPFSLNDEWNLISRTIVPISDQNHFSPDTGGQSGIGDITEAMFFSPKAVTARGLIWGAGPQFLLPTATSDALGSAQWGIGPTVVMLKQREEWTFGALVGQMFSVAGDDSRTSVNITNFQPFVAYVTPAAVTYSANLESTYNRRSANGQEWSIPLNLMVSKVLRIRGQLLSVQGGVRYWVDAPDNGPDDIGFRAAITLLYPR